MAIRPHSALSALEDGAARLLCVFTNREEVQECDAAVLVTARLPEEALLLDLRAQSDACAEAGIRSVAAIGDALAPGTIAAAVYAGRKYAERLDGQVDDGDSLPFRREIAELTAEWPEEPSP